MLGILNPTLLWALAAAALPLLIHLLTRRKLRVVAISTIAFLKRLERENIRRLKLRQWLLLALRMLIIALLVLAFARPTLREGSSALAQRAKASAAIILDNSLSMSSAPHGVSHLDLAKRHANALAENFVPGDEIFLITASKPSRLVAGSPFLELGSFQEAVQGITSTWQETDLAGALALAREKLESSHNVNRELYVLSDCRDDNLPSSVEMSGVRGFVIRYSEAMANNLTLGDASLANQIFERRKTFEVVATVQNNGDQDRYNQLVHLYLNNKRVAQQSIDVPAGSERSVNFRAVPDTTGFISGRVSLEDDDLPLDNSRFFSFYIPTHRRLLAVGNTVNDLAYLSAVLRRSTNSNGDQSAIQELKEISAGQLPAENFSDYDGILLSNVGRFPEGTVERLAEFVNSGGGLMIWLGSDVDLRHYNQTLLARLGLGQFGETVGALSNGNSFVKLGKIDFSHPIFDNVFESGEKPPRLDSPVFHFVVQFHPAGGTNAVMDYANNFPFMAERRAGQGRVLLFTSSMNEEWSDVAFKGLFAPLVHRSVTYIAQSRDNVEGATLVGNELNAALRTHADQLALERPDGDRTQIPVHVVGQNYSVQVPETDLPGFYTLRSNNEVINLWAVNFDSEEMKAEPSEVDVLADAAGIAEMVELPSGGDLAKSIREARHGSELWRMVLIAAVMAMIVEMLLYRSGTSAPSGKRRIIGKRRDTAVV